MRIPVNMATAELDLCGVCRALVFKSDAGLLDVWTSGPYYADTDTRHAHQAPRAPASGNWEAVNNVVLRCQDAPEP